VIKEVSLEVVLPANRENAYLLTIICLQ